jgi:Flp pilus assembly protein TadB
VSDTWSFVYWTTALVLAYTVIAYYYVRSSRARGVGTRVGPYIAAGVGIAVVVTAAAIWAAHHPPGVQHQILGLHLDPQSGLTSFLYRLAGPAGAIGLALLVLAWLEHNVALMLFTLLYLAVVLVPVTFGWTISRPSPWFFLPHLAIAAGLLLIGSLGFALTQPTAHHLGRS